jgi:hypothetical protein
MGLIERAYCVRAAGGILAAARLNRGKLWQVSGCDSMRAAIA